MVNSKGYIQHQGRMQTIVKYKKSGKFLEIINFNSSKVRYDKVRKNIRESAKQPRINPYKLSLPIFKISSHHRRLRLIQRGFLKEGNKGNGELLAIFAVTKFSKPQFECFELFWQEQITNFWYTCLNNSQGLLHQANYDFRFHTHQVENIAAKVMSICKINNLGRARIRSHLKSIY